MDQVLHGISSAYGYIDDVLIASPTPEQHPLDPRAVFERLAAYGILINHNKCRFGTSELDFIGHRSTARESTLSLKKFKLSETFPNLSLNASCEGLPAW